MAERLNTAVLNSFRTQNGTTISELSKERPVLLIFLRHFG